MTFKQKSGTSYVIGGGSRGGTDKTMQFNGSGKVSVKFFYVSSVFHPIPFSNFTILDSTTNSSSLPRLRTAESS